MSEPPTIDAEGTEVEQPSTAALVRHMPAGGLTRPIAGVEDVRAAFEEYEKLRTTIITRSDVQVISGKEFVTKSGWRKLAVVMGVSSEIVSRDYQWDSLGRILTAEVVVRAIAPNGRSIDGLGLCDFHERCCPKAFDADAVCRARGQHQHCALGCDGFNHFSKAQHDIPATASTRALNRACADLFGFGEVSAEEVTDREEPADAEDIAAIAVALDSIADRGQRTNAKNAFVRQFGLPAELRKGQIEAARRFCTASGASFDTPPAGDGACLCPGELEDGFVNPDCPLHGSATTSESPATPPEAADPASPPCDTDADETATQPTLAAKEGDDDWIDPAVLVAQQVDAMPSSAVFAELEAAGLATTGAPKALKKRLTAHRIVAEGAQSSPVY